VKVVALFSAMIQSSDDLEIYNHGYKFHAFNELVSGRIGYQARSLPDTRPKRYKCSLQYTRGSIFD